MRHTLLFICITVFLLIIQASTQQKSEAAERKRIRNELEAKKKFEAAERKRLRNQLALFRKFETAEMKLVKEELISIKNMMKGEQAENIKTVDDYVNCTVNRWIANVFEEDRIRINRFLKNSNEKYSSSIDYKNFEGCFDEQDYKIKLKAGLGAFYESMRCGLRSSLLPSGNNFYTRNSLFPLGMLSEFRCQVIMELDVKCNN
ncbi:unnamed protein product [Schistosoma turkestanicum]|nr:unnamed protein product [Schistosoma turkestanicum]